MTDKIDETKTGSTVEKTEDPLALLAKLSAQNSETLAELKESNKKIIAKLEDANPVEHGARLEAKPKGESDKEVGADITATNDYGRSTQASIIAPASGKENTNDKDGLAMENKSLDSKLDSVYKTVAAVRPAFVMNKAEERTTHATAYQMLKAWESGFDGKFKKVGDSYDEVNRRLQDGDFGTGFPKGYF